MGCHLSKALAGIETLAVSIHIPAPPSDPPASLAGLEWTSPRIWERHNSSSRKVESLQKTSQNCCESARDWFRTLAEAEHDAVHRDIDLEQQIPRTDIQLRSLRLPEIHKPLGEASLAQSAPAQVKLVRRHS